jgi:hypothetical protein
MTIGDRITFAIILIGYTAIIWAWAYNHGYMKAFHDYVEAEEKSDGGY